MQEWLAKYGYDAARIKAQLSQAALTVGKFIASNTVAFGGGAAHFLTNLALVLYIAFFLVRDGEWLKRVLIRALPFGDQREELLFRKFAGVMRATVKGSLLVAMVQGALGGLIFWLLDIRAPVLWGVAMTLLSLIPVVGAALVWGPTALFLLAAGHPLAGSHPDRLRRGRYRTGGQPVAPPAGGTRHQAAGLHGSFIHAGRFYHVRHGRVRHRPHAGGAFCHRVADIYGRT